VLDYLGDEPVKVILFGSRATGQAQPFSDADIGILPRQSWNESKLALLREKVEEMNIPYTVDIVNLALVSPSFRRRAIRDGEVWKE
jgi:predicted nucleotidyltransferase